ncbi:MAG: lysophospholipid acyltransferase family protein [Candidatus Kerfeldbacteria bacterium]
MRKKRGNVTGIENLPEQPPFIVAVNHEGFFDPLVLLTVLYNKYKRQIFFLTAQNIWGIWGEYLAIHWLGMIPLHEDNQEKKGAAVNEAISYLNKGEIFGIFPEGSRNSDKKNLLKGKTGTVRIAIGSKMKVVPIGLINNTGYRIGEAIKSLFNKDKKVEINIGQPIDFSEYYGKEIDKSLLEDATRKLMKEIGKLSNKEYNY